MQIFTRCANYSCSVALMSLLRSLHFEAVTMAVAHLKTSVTTDAGLEGSRKLTPVEKVARLQEEQACLKDLTIKGRCNRRMP